MRKRLLKRRYRDGESKQVGDKTAQEKKGGK